jgi:hypothetical protein
VVTREVVLEQSGFERMCFVVLVERLLGFLPASGEDMVAVVILERSRGAAVARGLIAERIRQVVQLLEVEKLEQVFYTSLKRDLDGPFYVRIVRKTKA